jgi:hypothetical protein
MKKKYFPELAGRTLMLCDVIYQRGIKDTGWVDYINFVYKDLVTNEKGVYTIKNPTITLYEVPEDLRTFRKPRWYMEKEKLIPHEVLYRNVTKEIANIIGPEGKKFWNERETNKERKQLFKYPYCLGGDIPIETYYRVIWDRELGNEVAKAVDCIYLDIEINQKGWEGGIPRHGECPVDLITVTDGYSSTSYTFLLKVKDNPAIEPFIKERQSELQKELHDRFDETFPNHKFNLYAFDTEEELLVQVFRLITTLKRDVCYVWNMDFDIPYLINRLIKLGMNPIDVFCNTDFPIMNFFYHADDKNFDFDTKRNFFDCASYTHYLDQPANYAGLRRSQSALRSVSLNAIAIKEAVGEGKIKFDQSGGNFVNFSYNNYYLYVIYNINDTLLQLGIDRKSKDSYNLYIRGLHNFCNWKDSLKQTVTFRAFLFREFTEKYNLVLGHNANFDNVRNKFTDEELEEMDEIELYAARESFEGAINGDPELNGYNGLTLFGKKNKYLYGGSIDFDFSAMYPNSICGFNIFAPTMIGKLFIEGGDSLKTYDEDAGKEFVEDMIAGNVNFTGTKWFGLPSFEELDKEVASALGIKSVND